MATVKDQVVLAGYVARLRFSTTSNGRSLLAFTLEMPYEEGKEGQYKGVRKIAVKLWGDLAEEFSALEEGANVEVEGPIDTRNWKKPDNTWGNETSINARRLVVIE